MIIELTRKKLFLVGSFIVVLIAIPLTLYLARSPQESRSRATGVAEDAVIVTIDGQDFTKADVRDIAEEQYEAEAVDDPALNNALEVLVERNILDIEADELGVSAETSEIDDRATQEEISETEARYEILREKITLATTKSRKTLSLGFWSPKEADQAGLDDSEKDLARQVTTAGRAALSTIETRMRAGDDLPEIADDIIREYPVLKDFLAINGYRISELTLSEKEAFSVPDILEFGDSNMDAAVLDGVFEMSIDQVRKFQATETNDGGFVFKVLEKGNDTGPTTYDAWLTERKSALVIPKGSL